jgi:NADH-quinone oxidoreductase subunit E
MLSDEELRDIQAFLPHYPERRAVSIEVLKVLQQHRGWVSDAALADAAEFLGIGRAELEGVATFYNAIFRRPVGRHVILYCDSVSCWIMGCTALRQRLESTLGVASGGTTADGRFTLLPNVCLGACDRAPVLMIDRDLHGEVALSQLETLLGRYA